VCCLSVCIAAQFWRKSKPVFELDKAFWAEIFDSIGLRHSGQTPFDRLNAVNYYFVPVCQVKQNIRINCDQL
jgi:hypothetical protein